MLGMGAARDEKLYAGITKDTGQTNSIQISYMPNITIQGSADSDEVQQAVSMGADDVVRIIRDYMAGQARVSYKR
jgi:hypothetical protein